MGFFPFQNRVIGSKKVHFSPVFMSTLKTLEKFLVLFLIGTSHQAPHAKISKNQMDTTLLR